LNSNKVNSIKGPVNKNLLHLGLSFNEIDIYLLNDIHRFYPCLFSLNVSHNKLIDLKQTVDVCSQFTSLKVLILRGNPCALVEGYKAYCINQLKTLRLFDVTPIPKEDSKKKKSLKSEKNTRVNGDIILNNDISFDLTVSVLGGVSGTKITEELCQGIENFEELEPKYKSSRFWIQTDFLGEHIRSEVKLWDTEFMKEEGVGKTDFKLSLRKIVNLLSKDQKPEGEEKYSQIPYSDEIFASLMQGLWIELYEEYPIVEEFETEEGETQKRAVIMDNLPTFKTVIKGVTKITTESWIMNPNLNSNDQVMHQKCYFYKMKYKNIPEFFYDNHIVKFKNSELEAIDMYVKAKREKMAQQEQEDREKAAEKVRQTKFTI